jgi:hypothetical protein
MNIRQRGDTDMSDKQSIGQDGYPFGEDEHGVYRSGPPGTNEEDPKAPYGWRIKLDMAKVRAQGLDNSRWCDRLDDIVGPENWRLEKATRKTAELPQFTYIRLCNGTALLSALLAVDGMLAPFREGVMREPLDSYNRFVPMAKRRPQSKREMQEFHVTAYVHENRTFRDATFEEIVEAVEARLEGERKVVALPGVWHRDETRPRTEKVWKIVTDDRLAEKRLSDLSHYPNDGKSITVKRLASLKNLVTDHYPTA